MINPDDYIITRKRKKYKFAKFANSPLCFEYDEYLAQSTTPVDVLEIGAGTGLFSVALAKQYTELEFVALDVKGDRLQTGAYQAAELQLPNIRFVRARADQLPELFPAQVKAIWITFPDPFPRRRSAGRRLTHPNFLTLYQQLLQPGGALYLKHDNQSFFQWSLEQLVTQGWRIEELSFDLHESDLADEYKYKTTYETRWLKEGLVTHFVKATPPVSSKA
ncbi:MAG: tRNA (guanosine(46)-N7)-methyltransferase TrmB [Candidatus Saccharibacteria bacterium]|nr:tRNA (guanosine(46)-N7)-methyltransferase TrmB [Candidatus Saccharibacteria bacterium]